MKCERLNKNIISIIISRAAKFFPNSLQLSPMRHAGTPTPLPIHLHTRTPTHTHSLSLENVFHTKRHAYSSSWCTDKHLNTSQRVCRYKSETRLKASSFCWDSNGPFDAFLSISRISLQVPRCPLETCATLCKNQFQVRVVGVAVDHVCIRSASVCRERRLRLKAIFKSHWWACHVVGRHPDLQIVFPRYVSLQRTSLSS